MQTSEFSRPWPRVAMAVPRGGMLAYMRGFTMTVWFLSLLVGLWWVTDWFALQDLLESGFNRKQYFYYGIATALLGHLTLGLQAWVTVPFRILSDWAGRLIVAFCLLMFCLAPTSAVPKASAMYAVGTAGVVVIMWLFWTSNYHVLQRVLTITGFVLFGWLMILLLHHGLAGGFGGAIGGVNRNVTGTAALAAMVLAMFSPKRILRWAAFGSAVFFIVIVSSRGSIVALAVFAAVYYLLYKGTGKAILFAGAAGLLGVVVLLVSAEAQHLVFERIFHLHDRARGLGSGFTGRVEMWERAIDAFWKRPMTGWGFRAASLGVHTPVGGVHSGWLKIFAECGLIGGMLIIAIMLYVIVRRFFLAWGQRTMKPSDLPGIDLAATLHINVLTCASFCMLSTMWVYDQYYINLGSPVSVLFFLMLAAPTYITTQGVTLRR